jgi:hypothetical protein
MIDNNLSCSDIFVLGQYSFTYFFSKCAQLPSIAHYGSAYVMVTELDRLRLSEHIQFENKSLPCSDRRAETFQRKATIPPH